MLRSYKIWSLIVAGLLSLLSEMAQARPASYVPDHQWIKHSWQCKKAARSLIEIESLRPPTSFTTTLKVVDLRINGRRVATGSIKGLDAHVGTLDAVQTIVGSCGWTGEFVIIFGFVHGRSDPRATERKQFFIRYVR